jgi:large subunit ribosomal protein L13
MAFQKTTTNKGNTIERKWHLIDLNGQTLGRICTQMAELLMGKGKVTFSPHADEGDYVIAINASKVQVTGRKAKQKMYVHYSGFAGGLKELTFAELMKKDPRKVIMTGVYGMLPKNKLRDLRIKRLKVFVGETHPFAEKLK